MASARERREQRHERAGSSRRDSQHRMGGEWNTITIPEGTDVWKPKAGTARLDIVPYVVGEGNPYADPGSLYYERTFWIHRGVGPNNESYVCPYKTAKQPCPICEHRGVLARDPDTDEKLLTALKPKERQLWLVYDHDDRDKGVQLWESSHHTFGKLLDKRRQDAEEDEPHITDFDDPAAGATLKISFSEEDTGGYKFLDAYSIDFKPRAKGLTAELLEHGVCLDDLIKVPDYAKLKATFLQTAEPDEDEEPEDDDRPTRSPAKRAGKPAAGKTVPASRSDESELEEGQMVEHDEFGECEIIRISSDATSLVLKDEDGDLHKAVDTADVTPVEEKPKGKRKPADEEDEPEEDDEPPAKPTKGKVKAKPADDDDDWDTGEEWDADTDPPPKLVKGKATGKAKAKPKDDDWD